MSTLYLYWNAQNTDGSMDKHDQDLKPKFLFFNYLLTSNHSTLVPKRINKFMFIINWKDEIAASHRMGGMTQLNHMLSTVMKAKLK